MRHYVIEPEVPGHLGQGTDMDRTIWPPHINKLHYVFDGWLGDDIVTALGAYLVTDRLYHAFSDAPLTGCDFGPVRVSTSSQFRELYPGRDLPKFHWLRVTGRPGIEDFGIDDQNRLIMSGDAMILLDQFRVYNAEITPF